MFAAWRPILAAPEGKCKLVRPVAVLDVQDFDQFLADLFALRFFSAGFACELVFALFGGVAPIHQQQLLDEKGNPQGILTQDSSPAPILKSAACSAALARSSASSSNCPSGRSCLRRFLRSAFSRCFCMRACSFCRFVDVDLPLGIHNPSGLLFKGS